MLSFFLQFHEKELGKNQEQYRFLPIRLSGFRQISALC